MTIRIGNGYDVHRLEEGLPLWLGGIFIGHTKGCVAHSDGDVAIHALCDALLGAAALRDIGTHFPDNSDRYKKIDSKILLKRTAEMIRENGYSIGNVDITLCLEQPKVKNHIPEMQHVLAGVLEIEPGCVSVKATTTEKLGFVGREEGIAAYAVALISKQ